MREMSKVVRDAIASSGELSDRVVTPHKQSVTRVSNPGDVALSRQEREEAEEELLAIGATRSRGLATGLEKKSPTSSGHALRETLTVLSTLSHGGD